MTAAKLDLVYKVWHAGGRSWRYEVRTRKMTDPASAAVVTTTGCADSEKAAAEAALVVIKVERNKAAAEWRTA